MTFASIIIPTYNRADYVKEAVDSVLVQGCKDVEVVVIDDGSTDDTKNVLADYINSGHIVYKWQENNGRSEARNHGAKISKGEFLLFLDSDDVLHEQAIANLRQLTLDHPRSGLFGGLVGFFKDNEPPVYNVMSFNPTASFSDVQVSRDALKIFLSIGAFIIRRTIFFKDSGFVKGFEPSEDLDFSIKSMHAALFTLSKEFAVVHKRRHDENTNEKRMSEASLRTCDYYLKKLKAGELPNFSQGKSKLFSDFYERMFVDCIYVGKKRKGVYCFFKMTQKNILKIASFKRWKFLIYLVFVK